MQSLGACSSEAEKKREAKQRAKEAQERELRKREKAEEKERRRKEYDALKAAKREQEKKPKKEANQAPSRCPPWWAHRAWGVGCSSQRSPGLSQV